MIELKGRGFALLATVLSFIADNRDTQESIRWRLGSPANSGREFSKTGDHPSLSAFVTLARTPPILTRRLTCHLTKCSCEIGLAGKVECERNIDQGLITSH